MGRGAGEDGGRAWRDASANTKNSRQPPEVWERLEQIPCGPQKEPTPATPCFWTSGLQNRETIHFYCFKPPSLQHFHPAALRNENREVKPLAQGHRASGGWSRECLRVCFRDHALCLLPHGHRFLSGAWGQVGRDPNQILMRSKRAPAPWLLSALLPLTLGLRQTVNS